jgi:hypothetical protein
VRIYRHLRRGSQTPAGGPPPPVQPSVRKVRLPLSLSPSRSARPGHSAAESFAPRLPFGPAPSTREGKAKVHSLHLRAQALRQAANDQRALEPSSWEADGEKGGDSLLRPPLREGSWRARTQGAASRGPDACPMSIKALARLTRLPQVEQSTPGHGMVATNDGGFPVPQDGPSRGSKPVRELMDDTCQHLIE